MRYFLIAIAVALLLTSCASKKQALAAGPVDQDNGGRPLTGYSTTKTSPRNTVYTDSLFIPTFTENAKASPLDQKTAKPGKPHKAKKLATKILKEVKAMPESGYSEPYQRNREGGGGLLSIIVGILLALLALVFYVTLGVILGTLFGLIFLIGAIIFFMAGLLILIL